MAEHLAQSPHESGDPEHARWVAEEVAPHESSLKAWLRQRFPWLLEVDDVVQESVIRLWRTRNNGANIRSPKGALFTIARNAVFDLGRRRSVARIDSVAAIETLSVSDEQSDVAESVSTRQELEFLAEALRKLPERCRQVLTLRKMYGYSQKEVSARLGISEHTVHAQVAKGMVRCAEYLRRKGMGKTDHDQA